jgi:carbonic anhydrase/acetyltransferase-like protein (isoleucine patch superfamily)
MLIPIDGITPELAEDVFVAPGAYLIGRVRAAAGCSFWYGSVVRGDNDWISIGAGSNLQDGAVVHTDDGLPLRIGERCTIGHQAMLHGCTLEDDVLIGIGAKVLNGAHIESQVVVAAGALVPERARLETGFVYMGVPARKARELSSEERERFRFGSLHYIEQARRHAAALK